MHYGGKKKKFFLFIPFIIIAGILLFGWIVMLLWNAILPSALHAGELTYAQAIGLLILCRILFGGFWGKKGGGGPGFKQGMYWREKWAGMSDEEKAKFKEQWRMRCGRPAETEKKEV
jgi:membrane protease YdiL (CAAX protease family)